MAIWTSRYSNKGIDKDKHYCVGISLGQPKFKMNYPIEVQCYSLAPKGYMLRMELEDFKPAYFGKLEGIGKDRIIDMVLKFEREAQSRGKELVLLCYEDVRIETDWCHRTVFAEWWLKQTGERIDELPDPNPPKGMKKKDDSQSATQPKVEEPQPKQLSLFDFMAGATT